MDYKKVAERLAEYKLLKGELIYDYTGIPPGWPDIYGLSGNHEENKKIWMNNLEKIVKMRHSKNKFFRYLSKL